MARYALLIAAGSYEDPTLAQLRSPVQDVDCLAEVLQDPEIGEFAVTVLVDRPDWEIRRAVDDVLADRSSNDFVMIYFSCHGVKDRHNRLHFATHNTRHDRLPGTSVPASFVSDSLERSRAGGRLLVLDCCNSGSFARGFTKAGTDSPLSELAEGNRGYVCITACDSFEYALEGDHITPDNPRMSIFTNAMIEGLRSGDADLNEDGLIDAYELFVYTHDKVRQVAEQTPSYFAARLQGLLPVAKTKRAATYPRLQMRERDVIAGPLNDPVHDAILGNGNGPWWERGFQIGRLKTSLVLIEGDGQQPIAETHVHVRVDHIDVELPAEVATWRADIETEQLANQNAGRLFRWNGPNYALSDFVISRLGINEEPDIYLTFRNSDYFTFMATQQLDRPLNDGSTLRSKHVQSGTVWDIPDFMCCSFGLNMAVVTADKYLVFSKRSQLVGSAPGKWGASANEAVSRTLDSQGRSAPNLHEVARRGIREELAIERHEYDLDMLDFHIDAATCQWGGCFLASLNSLTAQELLDRVSRGAPDKWEHEDIELVQFTPHVVIRHLLRDDRIAVWGPATPQIAYLSLIRSYGKDRVERDLSRVLSELNRAFD